MDPASFTPPFDISLAHLVEEVPIELPLATYTDGDPPVRPGVARYAEEQLLLLHFTLSTGGSVTAPATCAVRLIQLTDPMLQSELNGLTQLVELSPLPFGMTSVLRKLRGGVPTFYLGFPGVTVQEGDLVRQGDLLVQPSPGTHCYLGVLFQDRLTLAPWAWITFLRDAMQAVNQDVGAWSLFLNGLLTTNLYTNEHGLRLLDAQGRSLPGTHVRWRSAPTSAWQTSTSDARGKLALPLDGAGSQIELQWLGDNAGGVSQPVQALYEILHVSSPPGRTLILPFGLQRGHVQLLELARWFAQPPATSQMQPYRLNSRIQPIVDGIPTFQLMVDDLLACGGEGSGAHFAGFAFKDFPLDAARQGVDTRLTALTQKIQDAQGEASFLIFKFLNLKPGCNLEKEVLALFYLTDALFFLEVLSMYGAVGFAATLLGFFFGKDVVDMLLSHLEDKAEQSKDIFKLLNSGANQNTAIWASHPARFVDNPLYHEPLLPVVRLEDCLDQLGSLHQKIQLIVQNAQGPDGAYKIHIAYIGGIDFYYDRLDDPGHHGQPYKNEKKPKETLNIVHPFHDVHARITGPAVVDIFKTWDERFLYHIAYPQPVAIPPRAFPPPTESDVKLQDEKHIIQIARTYPEPAPTSPADHAFSFAPGGEKSINDGLISALRAAREYIYIEDQYFTPNDGARDTFFDVLLEARNTCKRLLILVPTETDQPFGDARRRKLFSKLRDGTDGTNGWGDRVLIGAPVRRPILYKAELTASKGRCILMDDIEINQTTLVVGPKARVPDSYPFWLWVEGELMLCCKQPKDAPDVPDPNDQNMMPVQLLEVLRGKNVIPSAQSAAPRPHRKGAPVTISQLKGIYVHSKTVIIDDVLVSIGSSNINRRGLFHDGEIRAFAVPEELKAAQDNPARSLRTALWAEHLGLPPAMGASLLADPIAAFELFRRTSYEGNRFTPFEVLDFKRPYFINLPAGSGPLSLLGDLVGLTEAELIPNIWNVASDPTSFNDFFHQNGP